MSEYFPPSAFYFEVRISGMSGVQGQFQEVSGIDVEVEVERLKEAGNNSFEQPVPGRTKYNNLVLKRGLFVEGSAMAKWVKKSAQSNLEMSGISRVQLKDVIVSLLDPSTGSALMSWSFVNAFPVKWSLGALNSQESAVAIENIELAYQEWKFA